MSPGQSESDLGRWAKDAFVNAFWQEKVFVFAFNSNASTITVLFPHRSTQFLKEYQDAFMFNELERGAGDAPTDSMETSWSVEILRMAL